MEDQQPIQKNFVRIKLINLIIFDKAYAGIIEYIKKITDIYTNFYIIDHSGYANIKITFEFHKTSNTIGEIINKYDKYINKECAIYCEKHKYEQHMEKYKNLIPNILNFESDIASFIDSNEDIEYNENSVINNKFIIKPNEIYYMCVGIKMTDIVNNNELFNKISNLIPNFTNFKLIQYVNSPVIIKKYKLAKYFKCKMSIKDILAVLKKYDDDCIIYIKRLKLQNGFINGLRWHDHGKYLVPLDILKISVSNNFIKNKDTIINTDIKIKKIELVEGIIIGISIGFAYYVITKIK